MLNREFLQLAHEFQEGKINIANWFWSEKMDGVRAFWDGGISRNKWADEIPFANTAKDYIRINRPKATGLWSRYGKVIHAPDWWLDHLPPFPLDGELWSGVGNFQSTVSAVKKIEPIKSEWSLIEYHVFDTPPYESVFMEGRINNPNFQKIIKGIEIPTRTIAPKNYQFENVVGWLKKNLPINSVVRLADQGQLHWRQSEAEDELQSIVSQVTSSGGEGVMIRSPISVWFPKRNNHLLKVKKLLDSEAKVIGYVWGRETDKGSKLAGLMGALVVNWNGIRFELSGFTNGERILVDNNGDDAKNLWMPGQPVQQGIVSKIFPIGSTVTFTYRELTVDGVPKEARFFRAGMPS